jgi:Zn finger protein HypA/HybF involved in hydrogenase expression
MATAIGYLRALARAWHYFSLHADAAAAEGPAASPSRAPAEHTRPLLNAPSPAPSRRPRAPTPLAAIFREPCAIRTTRSPPPPPPAHSPAPTAARRCSSPPASGRLACATCGTVNELPALDPTRQRAAAHEELDFREALAQQAGSEAAIDSADRHCPQCGAQTVFDPHVVASQCAFCASPMVSVNAHAERQIKPRGVGALCARSRPGAGAAFARGSRAAGSRPTRSSTP